MIPQPTNVVAIAARPTFAFGVEKGTETASRLRERLRRDPVEVRAIADHAREPDCLCSHSAPLPLKEPRKLPGMLPERAAPRKDEWNVDVGLFTFAARLQRPWC